MYYPLLRGRQFELIALRELSYEGVIGSLVFPIIEPVKSNFSSLNTAYKELTKNGSQFYLILNPRVGEIQGDGNYFLDHLCSSFHSDHCKSAFYFNYNQEYIIHSIVNGNLTNCMLICDNDIDSNSPELLQVLDRPEIEKVCLSDPGRNRSLVGSIRSKGKDLLRLDDLFEGQARNSDFLDIHEHLFSEEHRYFLEENFSGFSDYTVLPHFFSEGGSTPRAVVIHISYLGANDQILIRHFTSNSNDSIANVQGKFAEAAEKAISFCDGYPLDNSAILELKNYFEREHYPGLGTVKKISIKNHILVVSSYLSRN